MDIKPKKYDLFTIGNPKTKKGESLGYLTLVLHMSPWKDNKLGVNLCPYATKECIKLCLNDSGRSEMQGNDGTIKNARRRKANEFLADRKTFLFKLMQEIKYYERKAEKQGLKIAVRLNGTTDIQWYKVKHEGKSIFEIFSHIQFYDYTKDPMILNHALLVKNYHITFSWSGENEKECYDAIEKGFNIAVAFTGKKSDPLPDTFLGLPVLNADLHDCRFLDLPGHIAGLKVKGIKARKVTESTFLVTIERKNAA
jgi:hypothetical protein